MSPKKNLTGAVILAVCVSAPLTPSNAEEPFSGWSRITGGVGGDIQNDQNQDNSDNQGNLQVEIFKPLTSNSRALSFTDMRAFYEPDDTVEVNFGLGARSLIGAGNYGLGINGAAGYGRNAQGTDAFRGSLGVEAFTRIFDARVTGYEGTRKEDVISNELGILNFGGFQLHDHTLTMVQNAGSAVYQRPATEGVSGEIGANFVGGITRDLSLASRFWVGGYFFHPESSNDHPNLNLPDVQFINDPYQDLSGVRGGVSFRLFGDRLGKNVQLIGGVQVSYDQTNEVDVAGGAGVHIAFGGREARPTGQIEDRLVDPIHLERFAYGARQVRAQVSEYVFSPEFSNDPLIGNVMFADAKGSASASGKQGHPTTLTRALQQSSQDAANGSIGDGSLVVVTGKNSAPNGVNVNSGQILLGGNSEVLLQGARTGTRAYFAPGLRAGSVAGTAGVTDGVVKFDGVTKAQIIGVDVEDGQKGIDVQNSNDVLISGLTVKDMSQTESMPNYDFIFNGVGIDVGGSNDVRLRDVAVSNISTTGAAYADAYAEPIDGYGPEELATSGVNVFAEAVGVRIEHSTNVTVSNLAIKNVSAAATANGNGAAGGAYDANAAAYSAGLYIKDSSNVQVADVSVDGVQSSATASGVHTTATALAAGVLICGGSPDCGTTSNVAISSANIANISAIGLATGGTATFNVTSAGVAITGITPIGIAATSFKLVPDTTSSDIAIDGTHISGINGQGSGTAGVTTVAETFFNTAP